MTGKTEDKTRAKIRGMDIQDMAKAITAALPENGDADTIARAAAMVLSELYAGQGYTATITLVQTVSCKDAG